MAINETAENNTAPEAHDRLELWLRFLNAETEEELDELEQSGVPIIKKAVKVLRDLNDDPEVREAARIREKALNEEA